MAFDEPNVRILFPVPLVTVRLEDAAALNKRLHSEIDHRRMVEPSVDRSNLYGWHSGLDFFDRPEPAHAELCREIEAMVAAVNARLIPHLPDSLETALEGWVNVNPTNAMNAPHDHPGAFWSGTYYVHVPACEDEGDQRSGAIEFIDPRGSIGSNARFETEFTRGKFTARAVSGTCLLWPSFVRHWVHPNRSSEDRVSVSFNGRFARASA